MKLIYQSIEILEPETSYLDSLKICAHAASSCYGVTPPATKEEQENFIRKRIKAGHESVIEHGKISVKIISSIGVLRELMRARIASFTQESTRYCNYSKEKFGKQLTFIIPEWCKNIQPQEIKNFDDLLVFQQNLPCGEVYFLENCLLAETGYFEILECGQQPQQAREVLPLSLASKLYCTMNFREWRWFLNLRYFERTGKVQPEMKQLSTIIWNQFVERYPVFFKDLENV